MKNYQQLQGSLKNQQKFHTDERQNNDSLKTVFMVISDNSQHQELQKPQITQRNTIQQKKQPPKQAHNQQTFYQDLNLKEKQIRQMTFQKRLGLTPQSKPSKRIKLSQDSLQQAKIIRFGSIKANLQAQKQQYQDKHQINRTKAKRAIPWMSRQTKQIGDTCLRLHNQTVQFYEYLKPSKKEHETRLKIFNMIKQMISQKYPQAKVEYFGSFATKLYLPDGDIDVTVLIDDLLEYEERKAYDTIHKVIRKNEGIVFCDIQYIRNSKVPLIKFTHIDTQIPFDISINKKDGLLQIQHVERMKKKYPQFQPLVFVFKTMLKIRNMSQTYTGGIGSFLLSCMILHFLRYVHNKQCYYTLGEYVMKFMEYYGISQQWQRKSVYVADGSEVGRAREPGTLSFLSPQDDSHDIGKSAFKIRDVFNVFKNRFRVITGKNFNEGESVLKQLINPSLEEFRYYKYQKLMNKKLQQ